jgi:hypothetical protein
MKKYILRSGRKTEHFVSDSPSEINAKMIFLQSEGVNLINVTVTIIDTEKYPPATMTAAEWIKLTTPAPPEEIEKPEKNRLKRALAKIEELWEKMTSLPS